jgi:UDP-3-O-[3-hydroxymyristoyl] N-acetylglucosamine deacetylase / 3-hydroxyacyl-[acyl-carrier-protein] dehydratase
VKTASNNKKVKDCQHTIAEAIAVSGVGLHTGCASTVRFCAASEGYGYRFVRMDLPDSPEIPALVENVVSTNRATTIAVPTQTGEVRVQTVEHALAALVGMGIDNCRIEIDAEEIPILDGSALPFIQALQKAGVRSQGLERKYCELSEPLHYESTAHGSEIHAFPADELSIECMLKFTRVAALKRQEAQLLNIEAFESEIAPARTFCLFSELEFLVKQGLVRGGTLENAVVVMDDEYVLSNEQKESKLSALMKRFALPMSPTLGTTGYLNNTELRFPNEPARHKILDIVGDIALLGMPLKAHISALRSGHASNVAFVQKLRRLYIR